jgi:hypothetical protein
VTVNRDALVTAREAEDYPAFKQRRVTRHLIGMWKHMGKLAPAGKRGRSPLYRWGDLVDVEVATRTSGRSARAKMTELEALALAAEANRIATGWRSRMSA